MNTFNTKRKEEARLGTKFDKCRTRKCSKNIKKRNSVRNSFFEEQNRKCTQKSPKAFYDCSSKFYEGSNLKKLSEEILTSNWTKEETIEQIKVKAKWNYTTRDENQLLKQI